MSSWGFAVTGDPAQVERALHEACDAHFKIAEQGGALLGQRATAAREAGHDDLADEQQRVADFTLKSAQTGREQAALAIAAAVEVLKGEHFDPVSVSVTGEANPEHARTHELGGHARITISVIHA